MRAAVILGPLEQVVRAGLVDAAPPEIDLVYLEEPLQQIYRIAAEKNAIAVITAAEDLEAVGLPPTVPIVSVGVSSSTLAVVILAGKTRLVYLNPPPEAIFSAVLDLSGWTRS